MLSTIIPSKPEFDKTIIDILQRPEYKHLNNSLRDFIERIKDSIREWLFKILYKAFSNMPSANSVSNNLSTIFMIIGIVVILAITIFIILKVSKTFERRTKVREILGEKIDDKTTPLSLRNKARTFEDQGDYRQAIRFDFIALLLLMHEKTLLYLDETKTNEEIYRFLMKNSFPRLVEFRYMINIFNHLWYGHKPCREDMYEEWNNRLNLLWNEVIGFEAKKK